MAASAYNTAHSLPILKKENQTIKLCGASPDTLNSETHSGEDRCKDEQGGRRNVENSAEQHGATFVDVAAERAFDSS